MPDVTRTFIGLPIPGNLRLKLSRLAENLAGVAPGGRWTHPDDFHITLAFLGDVPHADIREVCAAANRAANLAAPFDLSLRGIGAFPNSAKPRVVWAGVAGDLEALAGLRRAVVDAVTAAGYPPDDDRFHPHVTLGRLKPKPGKGDAANLEAREAHLRTWTAGPWTVDSLVAFGSHRVADGPSYTALGTSRISRRNPKPDD